MAEYIEREAAIKMLRGEAIAKFPMSFAYGIIAASEKIKAIPAADVRPVVRGKWIELGKYSDGYNWRCSVCKRESTMAINYCPNCGADMRGE